MSDLILEILDQNYTRKAVTKNVVSCSITDELGAVGSANVEIPLDDPAAAFLPDPDAASPYEGRFNIYEDSTLVFSGVIDAETKEISESGYGVKFSGPQRGVLLGFYNTGRRDFLGYSGQDLFRELLRDNIAKNAVQVTVSSEMDQYQGVQMTTGDPFKQNYWQSATATPPHTAVIDLGSVQPLNAIRVMPIWWIDIDTKKFHYTNYTVESSLNGTSWTSQVTKTNSFPSDGRGELYTMGAGITARYIRLTVTGSTDGYAKVAQLLIYRDIADIGGSTVYLTPFVENDDSGNCNPVGSATRIIVPGAFQGDDVITRSYVTRLGSGGSLTLTFRGTQAAAFLTQHDDGACTVNAYVDGVLTSNSPISVPNNSYWFEAYNTETDLTLTPLSNGVHTLKIEQVSGTPQVDYFDGLFETSWRPIEDDDPALAYKGSWVATEAAYFYSFFASLSQAAGNELHFVFKGDRIRALGSKGPGFGSFTYYIDGVSQGTVSTANGTQINKQLYFDWSGSYATHRLRIVTSSSAKVYIDRLEGNLAHTMYIRSRYESNLKVLIRFSEIMNAFLRFNNDGSVDLLGEAGTYGGTVIREGENEGGQIIHASAENRYEETGSVCLALVNVNGELPIKAMVIDYEALREIGYKVIKLENSDAADGFLLNRQALAYLRDHRKPNRSYDVQFDPDNVGGPVKVGDTSVLYSRSLQLTGQKYRIGKITTDYLKE